MKKLYLFALVAPALAVSLLFVPAPAGAAPESELPPRLGRER